MLLLRDLAAVAVFAWGYLLVRPALPDASDCADFGVAARKAGCWAPAAHRRAVIIVLDGLRRDYAIGPEPWLRTPGLWAAEAPSAAVLCNLTVPPPTATLPAVRTLLTGGLPALLDVGAGVVWASHALHEDTLVDAARRLGRRVVAVGDDVWHTLLAGRLDGGQAFDCLDGADVDAADGATWDALRAAAADPNPGWDVFVAHLPGIDHAGHVGGAAAPNTRAAVARADARLAEVVNSLVRGGASPSAPHADTLLVVLGDHGMTSSGDHGGASHAETATMLFAADIGGLAAAQRGRASAGGGSGRRRPARPAPNPSETVSLTDMAPSLALLLGLPIPFSSVGRVRQALWALGERGRRNAGEPTGEAALAQALQVNALQVERYAVVAGLMQEAGWMGTIGSSRPTTADPSALDAYLVAVAGRARACHAQFGYGRMLAGLVALGVSLLARVRAVFGSRRSPAARQAATRSRVPGAAMSTPGAAAVAAYTAKNVALRPSTRLVLAATLLPVVTQVGCMFSVRCLQAEGRVLALLCAVLALAAGAATAADSMRHARRAVLAAAAAIAFNAVAATYYLPATRTAGQALHKVAAAGWADAPRAGDAANIAAAVSALAICWAIVGLPSTRTAWAWAAHACVGAAWLSGVAGSTCAATGACVLSAATLLAPVPPRLPAKDGLAHCEAEVTSRRVAAALSAPALLANGATAAPGTALLAGEIVAWGALVRQLPPEALGVATALAAGRAFHVAGHFCELAGLHWAAAGPHVPRTLGRAAVAADALAPHALAAALLPALVAGDKRATDRAWSGFALARTALLAAAAASAGLQHRHILAAGLFAPRLLFEAAFAAAAFAGHAVLVVS